MIESRRERHEKQCETSGKQSFLQKYIRFRCRKRDFEKGNLPFGRKTKHDERNPEKTKGRF